MSKSESNVEWTPRIIGSIGLITVIIFFFMILTEDKKDIVFTNTNTGKVYLTETKYFWGEVWFNKDGLSISYDEFNIEINSIIGGKETIQLPFSKVKKVIFEEGFGIYELTIESEGRIFKNKEKFYIQNKINFEYVKNKIMNMGRGSLVIEETRTILKRLSQR